MTKRTTTVKTTTVRTANGTLNRAKFTTLELATAWLNDQGYFVSDFALIWNNPKNGKEAVIEELYVGKDKIAAYVPV